MLPEEKKYQNGAKSHPDDVPNKKILLMAGLVGLIAFLFYWLTAYRTITWWDTSEYSLAAVCLGNPHPPGSLLLTILGWVFTRVPFAGSYAFTLNLLASLMACATVVLVFLIAVYLFVRTNQETKEESNKSAHWPVLIGAVLAALAFAFGETPWLYSVMFNPYILTTVVTALILWAIVRWWESAAKDDSFRWLFLTAFLFGLDLSVHRTNFLLLPGVIILILLRYPRTIISIKSWICGIVGGAAGLSIQLAIIPIAMQKPFLNGSDPSNFERFYNYLSLKQLGGSFLVQFFPRKAAFWNEQVMDFLRAFSANFFNWNDGLKWLGIIPVLLALYGLYELWKNKRRFAIGMILLFLVTSAITILYFNIPSNFFRSLHRHYLPCMVIFSIFVIYGTATLIPFTWRLKGGWGRLIAGLITSVIIAVPIHQLMRNFDAVDGSKRFFASDTARNFLNTLPENAILFTQGDNDTFPLWYIQQAEGVRVDVAILNLSLLNTSWFIAQQMERDSTLPLQSLRDELASLTIKPWADTGINIASGGEPSGYSLPEGVTLPDSIRVEIRPNISDKYLMVQDWVILQMLIENKWKRPIYFATTVAPIEWLSPYLCLEGMASRLIPVSSPPVNREILRKNLFERYEYRGYNDPDVPLEPATKWMGWNLYGQFLTLASDYLKSSDRLSAGNVVNKMKELLPPERLAPPEGILLNIDTITAEIGGN